MTQRHAAARGETAGRSAGVRDPGVPSVEVRAELDRILQSPAFANAPVLSRLLRHLVVCTLEGTADRLKEYSLGVDVFDRGESFDPRTDTIVRVQARRLRSKLEEYYRAHGPLDPVLIEIPRGRYSALFTACAAAVSDDHRSDRSSPGRTAPAREAAGIDAGRWSLPAAMTPLVGRERERAEIARLLLEAGIRLVTLAGPGGTGKTRLAQQVGHDLVSHFPGGVRLVPLAALADRTAVTTALARVLGLRHAGGRPLAEALREHVRTAMTEPTLLVLDNFEHVLPAVPAVIELMAAAPFLKVLVTSRSVLHAYGEQEYPVPPLPVPDADGDRDALLRSPAVILFEQRARAAHPGFAVTDDSASTVAQICRRLDGLPLAIELAAARIKLFPADAILARLEHALEFLTGGPHDLPTRQQTLRNTIDWSYRLLGASERRLFQRLAVFVGGCTLEGAEAVCNAGRDLDDVTGGMASLLDKSLVQHMGTSDGEARFNMLETLREYARERLAESGDELQTRRAHAAYCIVLAEEGNPRLTAAERERWRRRCDLEQDNFRAADDWLAARGDRAWALRLTVALFGFWARREQFEEARQRLQSALRLEPEAPVDTTQARALTYMATAYNALGDHHEASALHRQSLEMFRALGDRRGEAAQLTSLGVYYRFVGDYGAARACCEQALAICREIGEAGEIAAALSNLAGAVSDSGDLVEARRLLDQASALFVDLGDRDGVLWTLNRLGDLAREDGHLAEARDLYNQSLEGFTRAGDLWGTARASADLAYVAAELGDRDQAQALLRRALQAFTTLDHKRGIARVLEGFAWLARRDRAFERALMLAGAAATVRQTFGVAPRPTEQAALERSLEPAWESRDRAAARALWLAGGRMSLDEAIAYALA